MAGRQARHHLVQRPPGKAQRGSGHLVQFGGAEPGEPEETKAANYLVEFRLENQMPVWRYEVAGVVLEKQILMPYLQNTVHVSYRQLSGPPCRLWP